MPRRIIALVDLDYFYAQCEQNRKPELKGKAVVICMYSARGNDSGAVATSNYEARALGIHAGMPIIFAKRKIESAVKERKLKDAKDAAFLPADREHYKEVSDRVMEILRKHVPVLEQVSIDEAYFDLSEAAKDFGGAKEIVEKIKEEIKKKEKLTCSVGIASNKLIAKMAASIKKPDGLSIVEEKEVASFISPLKVSKLHGIGDKTEKILNDLGIITIGDLKKFLDDGKNYSKMGGIFGKNKAAILKEHANGIDSSGVEPFAEHLQYSKMGTLKEDTNKFEKIEYLIDELGKDLVKNVKKEGVKFKTISIIPITNEIKMHTKSKTLEDFTDSEKILVETSKELLKEFLKYHQEIVLRRFGVRASNLNKHEAKKEQKNLSAFREDSL